MQRASHQFRSRPSRRGFPLAYPRVSTIVSAGVVVALLLALLVAGLSLTAELADPAIREEGADPETLVLSGTVIGLIVVFAAILFAMLRRFAGSGRRGGPAYPA
ncbi:hypothetical protein [Phreatobacter sp.]|uniref:hypothetical protein n=1 Tax=Phreatobacter sp. TaxID=1966341 RepID=UPI003F6F6EE6